MINIERVARPGRVGPRRRRAVAALLAGAVLLAAAGCTGGQAATTEQADVDSAVLAADLDQAAAEIVAMPIGPPGVIVTVQRRDERTVHTAGVADVETGAVPTPDDQMRVASVAKAFSGATALALVSKGTMTVDDTIGQWLPDLPAAWADVTLRQLLNHTSGLPDFVASDGYQQAFLADPETPPTPAELLAFVEDEPLAFPPGGQYTYSNSDNVVVGLMAAAAAGKPYEQVLQSEVLDPLGMAHTSLPSGSDLAEPALHGYQVEPGAAPTDITTDFPPGWAWASGGIVSTPADLQTFVRGYVGGTLFTPEVRASQQDLFIPGGESGPPGPGENSAGMGLYRYQTPCGTVYGHTGNIAGYTQFIAASPDATRSITVSINAQRSEIAKTDALLAVLDALQRLETRAICYALS